MKELKALASMDTESPDFVHHVIAYENENLELVVGETLKTLNYIIGEYYDGEDSSQGSSVSKPARKVYLRKELELVRSIRFDTDKIIYGIRGRITVSKLLTKSENKEIK